MSSIKELIEDLPYIFSSISLVISIIALMYERARAKLAKIETNEKLAKQKLEHYDDLKRFFFGQVRSRLGNGALNENDVFGGVENYLKDLKQISEGDIFKKHWNNGMEHLKKDDKKSYDLLNSFKERLENLNDDTKDLNNLIETKVKNLLANKGLSFDTYPIPPGKVLTKGFLQLIKNDLQNYLNKCGHNVDDLMDCLKSSKQFWSPAVREDGHVTSPGLVFARISDDLSLDDINSLFSQIEKDNELLEKIIEIRKLRIQLREDLKKVSESCGQIINMIETKSYSTEAECCPK